VLSYIGLGSNLNDPYHQIEQALIYLKGLPSMSVKHVSRLYMTKPVGVLDQPDFVNAVMSIETCLSAKDLLVELQRVESVFGRKRLHRWGARTLDLDILLYGDECIETSQLIVPHAEMSQRAFVLYPLSEIVPKDFTLPKWGALGNC